MITLSLLKRIEKVRAELVDLGMKKGFQDPKVIEKSQQLDKLINQYYRVTGIDVAQTG